MAEIPEIKQLLGASSKILLVCDKNRSNFDYLAAASSLFYTLKKIGKVVNCYPQEIASSFPISSEDMQGMKNFVLTINNNSGAISDIYYQKGAKELKLYFTFANGELKTDDIHFSAVDSQETEPDIIITLGIGYLESLEDFYEENFKFFSQKPILNIDNNPTNQEFGKINIIEENASFSEMALDLIRSINREVADQKIATNLFWGMVHFYKDRPLSDYALKSLIYLKNKGAEIKKIPSLVMTNLSEEQKQLASFILSHLEFNKKAKMPIIMLPKGTPSLKEKDVLWIIGFLRGQGIFLPAFLLLWETESAVGGIMYSMDEYKIKKLASSLKGQRKDNKFMFYCGGQNIQKVFENILKFLD